MLNEKFILIAVIASLIGIIPYFRGTLNGTVRPNRVSWFLWIVTAGIAFAAEIRQGVGFPALTTLMAGFNPLLVFVATFFAPGQAVWKISRFDLSCGICAVLAIVLWQVSGSANVGLFFAIVAEVFAAIPTVHKAIRQPETENALPFLSSNVRHVLKILTVAQWSFASLAFVLYDAFINNFIAFLVLRKRNKANVIT